MIDILQAGYDLYHAMVLAQMHHFKAGILYLYEKAKLYVDRHLIFTTNIMFKLIRLIRTPPVIRARALVPRSLFMCQ